MDTLYNDNYDLYLNITNRVKQTQIHNEMKKWFVKKHVINEQLFNIAFDRYLKKSNLQTLFQRSPTVKNGIAQFFKDCLLCENGQSLCYLIDEIGSKNTFDFMMYKIVSTPYNMKYGKKVIDNEKGF